MRMSWTRRSKLSFEIQRYAESRINGFDRFVDTILVYMTMQSSITLDENVAMNYRLETLSHGCSDGGGGGGRDRHRVLGHGRPPIKHRYLPERVARHAAAVGTSYLRPAGSGRQTYLRHKQQGLPRHFVITRSVLWNSRLTPFESSTALFETCSAP